MDREQASFDLAVTVCSASNLAKKDVFGLSDPYVKISLIQAGVVVWKMKTSTVPKTLNPQWNETYIMRVDGAHVEDAKVVFEVFDANRLTRDDFLGKVEVQVRDIPVSTGSTTARQHYSLQQRSFKSRVSGHLVLHFVRSVEGAPRGDNSNIFRSSRSMSTTPQGSPALLRRDPGESEGVQARVRTEPNSADQRPVTSWHSAPSNEAPLPDNWEERTDNLGRRFYVNHAARTFQWERPVANVGERLEVSSDQRRRDAAEMYRRRHHASEDHSEEPSTVDTASGGESLAASLHAWSISEVRPSAPPEDEHEQRRSPSSPSAGQVPLPQVTGQNNSSAIANVAPRSNEWTPAPKSTVVPIQVDEPLPPGWAAMLSPSGRMFFVDHATRTTTWDDPRVSRPLSREAVSPEPKPARQSLLDGNDPTQDLGPLPAGWEELIHTDGRKFYIDHNTRQTTWDDPRLDRLRGRTTDYSLTYKTKYQQFCNRLKKPTGTNPKFEMKISRTSLLEESFQAIMSVKNVETLKFKLYIEFFGEHAYDYGGLSREWFFLVSREIFNPYYGLFEYSAIDNYTLQINNLSGMANNNHLQYFHFLGRVMGMAAFHGKLIDGFFISPLYKLMLKKPITISDMESVDLEYYNSLKWITENRIDDADLGLSFSVNIERYGETIEIDLVPGGKDIKVTDANKSEYVRLVIKWRFQDSIQKQLSSMMKGFTEIIPLNDIAIFDEHELELLLCGIQDIDVSDWKANTNYKGGYTANHPTIVHFWRLVYSLSSEGRARLLQFSTGTSRVPMNGFAELYGSNGPLKFCIEKVGTPRMLPRSHTCFNRLDLPPYETYEELRQKVLMALESSEGFGGVD